MTTDDQPKAPADTGRGTSLILLCREEFTYTLVAEVRRRSGHQQLTLSDAEFAVEPGWVRVTGPQAATRDRRAEWPGAARLPGRAPFVEQRWRGAGLPPWPPRRLTATGGEARILDLTVHRLRPIWR